MIISKFIDTKLLGKSITEVVWLLIISIMPNAAVIILAAFTSDNFTTALRENVIPGELVAYSLSFVAPTLYLFIKTHGKSYSLPLIEIVSIITLGIYVIATILCVVTKKGWGSAINIDQQSNLYYLWSIIFLVFSIIIWVYTVYHNDSSADYVARLRAGESNFNDDFRNRIK